jgi:hypothetical protein
VQFLYLLWPSYQVCKLALLLMQLEESKTYGKKSGARTPTGFGQWLGGPGGPSGGSGRGPYGGSGGGAPRGLTMCKGLITVSSCSLSHHQCC